MSSNIATISLFVIAPNIVSVADKDAIHEILVASDYPKSEIHEGLELYKQHSLFSSRNKEFHKNRVNPSRQIFSDLVL